MKIVKANFGELLVCRLESNLESNSWKAQNSKLELILKNKLNQKKIRITKNQKPKTKNSTFVQKTKISQNRMIQKL